MRPESELGWGLIEVMIAMVVLVVALMGTLAALSSGMILLTVNQETTMAINAARAAVENMQNRPFLEVFRGYNGTTADDAGLSFAAPGSNFAVSGLKCWKDDLDLMPGRVIFPTPSGSPGTLLESVSDTALGMPMDLTGDGDLVDDATIGYILLPVRVRVEWEGLRGESSFDLNTFLANR